MHKYQTRHNNSHDATFWAKCPNHQHKVTFFFFFFVSQIIQIINRCEKKMLHPTNSTFLLRLAEHHPSFLTRWFKYLSHTQIKAFETVYQLFWLNGWSSKVWQSNYLQNPIDPSPHVWICNNGKSSSKINSKKLNIET